MDSAKLRADCRSALARLDAAIKGRMFDDAKGCVKSIKLNLTRFEGLPPLYRQTPNQAEELTLARSLFENAVLLGVLSADMDYFELHFLQLKPYYTDMRHLIAPSPNEYIILGLNLLRLLVQNRIAEFHTELELLSSEALKHECIKRVVELEQALMEGAYNHVLAARKDVPHETFVYFMDLLAKTVRDEVAGCSEKAYDYLAVEDAKSMFLFKSDKELLDYIAQEHPEWEIRNNAVYFQKVKEMAPCKEMPSLQLISQSLGYARELERIV